MAGPLQRERGFAPDTISSDDEPENKMYMGGTVPGIEISPSRQGTLNSEATPGQLSQAGVGGESHLSLRTPCQESPINIAAEGDQGGIGEASASPLADYLWLDPNFPSLIQFALGGQPSLRFCRKNADKVFIAATG
jgi:hypothetical protein